jgi:hypothetical protein
MKGFLATALLCTLIISPVYSISLSGEFITGFESGIFLRNNPQMMADYGCPDAKTDSEEFKQFQAMI